MTSQSRPIGAFILAGVAASLIWRAGVAPAVLGKFDPADMPHRDRAMLSIGNVLTAACFAAAQRSIGRQARRGQAIAAAGAWAGVAGLACALAGTAGLVLSNSANALLDLYVACTVAAWVATGVTSFRLFAGVTGLVGLLTGLLYLLAATVILAGGHVIFLMAIAAAPLAVCLLFRRPTEPARGQPAAAPGTRAADLRR
jgi:hypothetical protein